MKHHLKYIPTRLRAHHKAILFLAAALLCIHAGNADASIRIIDDLGRTVTLEHPAKRVVPLYAAFSEMLVDMKLESVITGRTKADTFPPVMQSKPVVGTHMRPNPELVLGQKPDLVLQMAGRAKALEIVDTLQQHGVPAAVFNVTNFQGLFSVIERLGILCGRPQQAARLTQSLQKRLNAVAHALKNAPTPPRVFFEVRYPNLLAAGRHSIVSDIIAKAGGRNCVENNKKLVRLNEEALLGMAPEVYLLQRGPMNPELSRPEQRPHFHTLPAVRTGRVYVVEEKIYSRPGPRNVDAVEQLARLLHPELFSQNKENTHD